MIRLRSDSGPGGAVRQDPSLAALYRLGPRLFRVLKEAGSGPTVTSMVPGTLQSELVAPILGHMSYRSTGEN